jgi:hypothetical protein
MRGQGLIVAWHGARLCEAMPRRARQRGAYNLTGEGALTVMQEETCLGTAYKADLDW